MRYLSRTSGTKGMIKSSPEDFLVKEITANGFVLSPDVNYTAQEIGEQEIPNGKFVNLVVQKRDWETINALVTIAKRCNRGRKSISYAGTKDRRAVTVQLASIFGVTPQALQSVSIKDIKINGAWKGNQVELGSNLGNAFEVRITNAENAENAGKIIEELNCRMPNYFGEQRFGIRGNNAEIGMHIMRGELELAVMEFLTSTCNETSEKAIEARKKLADERDFSAAAKYFPRYLKAERTVINELAKNEKDFANALRKLPRGILIMFIHAVQSDIFNREVDERIHCKDFSSEKNCAENFYGFPDVEKVSGEGKYAVTDIVGYDTKEEDMNDYCKNIIEELQLKPEEFKIKSMPELSMRGSCRPILVNAKDLNYSIDNEQKTVKLSFSLPSGSYATVLLNEMMKSV